MESITNYNQQTYNYFLVNKLQHIISNNIYAKRKIEIRTILVETD